MKKVSVCLEKELVDWIEFQINNKEFESFSDGIRKCVKAIKEQDGHFAYLLPVREGEVKK